MSEIEIDNFDINKEMFSGKSKTNVLGFIRKLPSTPALALIKDNLKKSGQEYHLLLCKENKPYIVYHNAFEYCGYCVREHNAMIKTINKK